MCLCVRCAGFMRVPMCEMWGFMCVPMCEVWDFIRVYLCMA